MNSGLATLWKVGKLDIEQTIRIVCEEVLTDKKVDKNILKKRAEAIKVIGRLYKAAK